MLAQAGRRTRARQRRPSRTHTHTVAVAIGSRRRRRRRTATSRLPADSLRRCLRSGLPLPLATHADMRQRKSLKSARRDPPLFGTFHRYTPSSSQESAPVGSYPRPAVQAARAVSIPDSVFCLRSGSWIVCIGRPMEAAETLPMWVYSWMLAGQQQEIQLTAVVAANTVARAEKTSHALLFSNTSSTLASSYSSSSSSHSISFRCPTVNLFTFNL